MARRRPRTRYVLLILVLASATVITLGYRGGTDHGVNGLKRAAHDVVNPLVTGVRSVLTPIGNFIEGAFNYGSLRDQNSRLLEENARLRNQALAAQDARAEVAQLRKQLHLPVDVPAVPAEVVDGPANFSQTVTLDRGQSSGIAAGMPVVSGDALVGQVQLAWRTGCTVLLISDPSSTVGVKVAPTQGLGAASGQGAGQPLRVHLLNPAFPVHAGDTITTSGLQNASYPPDVVVGTVRSARLRPSATEWDVTVDPGADLTRLQFVTVLEWAAQG